MILHLQLLLMIIELWFLLMFTLIGRAPTCSEVAWHHEWGTITWPKVIRVWPGWRKYISTVCALSLCPGLLISHDSKCCPVAERLEQNWTSSQRHAFSESLHLKVGYLLITLNPTCQEITMQRRDKLHTREGLSSAFIAFQQLVSAYANISEIFQLWKMNWLISCSKGSKIEYTVCFFICSSI